MQFHIKRWIIRFGMFASLLGICSCEVGPNYVRPSVQTPIAFKEADKGWKIAQPQDAIDRGYWWAIFNDPELDTLENELNNSNQSIAAACANYEQALALVDEARAAYFPTIAGSAAITRQKSGSGGGSSRVAGTGSTASGAGTGGTVSFGNQATTNYSTFLTAAWEPDLWGGVRRAVEASRANAQSSAATLALTRLSSQAALAQDYFELRGVDADQRLLDSTVSDDQKALQITQNQVASGTASGTDIVQAQSQLEAAQAQAINNGINRALYEHAIAVLIGVPPAALTITPEYTHFSPPAIPITVPSVLLERRPDIAQSERLVAQANAQIGVAIAGYFPALNLSGATGFQNVSFAHLFSLPNLNWSLGAQLAQTIFNGGLTAAQVRAARANYCATVANYRETVLTAFQDVEDNLATLRILDEEYQVQHQAAETAELGLKLVLNQYKAGTVSYANVIVAQLTAYTAEKNAVDINYLRMSTAVALIKALGGGWNAEQIKNAGDP